MTLQDWFRAAKIGDIDYVKENVTEFKGRTTDADLTALMIATRNHQFQIVEILAPLEHGLYDSDGKTALSIAAALDDESSCAILLRWEKNLELPDGKNPLMVCVEHGGTNALLLLLEAYGQGCDALGRTVLEYAILSKSLRTLCITLDHIKPSSLEVASTVVKVFSDVETTVSELQGIIAHLTDEKQLANQQLKEVETELDAANLESHNLRCKIRSMEDYIDSIHDVLRQVTHMESIDDILTCLIDPAFNTELLNYLEKNKLASTTSVSTSPFTNILSCSPAELRNNQSDSSFTEELKDLKEQLACKDRELSSLKEQIRSDYFVSCSINEHSEYNLSMVENYIQQISDQRVKLEKQAEELHALRHLVGSMAVESIANGSTDALLTAEQQVFLDTAKEERLNALQQSKTVSREDKLLTIPEQDIYNDIDQFNYSFSKDSISDRDIASMYQVMKDLLGTDSSTQSLGDSIPNVQTLPTLRLFTETMNDSIETYVPVKFNDFKAVFEQLIKRFIDIQRESNISANNHDVCKSSTPRHKAGHSGCWQPATDSINSMTSKAKDGTAFVTEPLTTGRPTKSPSPPQLLSSCGEHQNEDPRETNRCISLAESAITEKDGTIPGVEAADKAANSELKSLSKAPRRIINVQQEDEELLRCMAAHNIPSTSERTSKNRALDLERIYGTLNGQDRKVTQTHQAETTVVSAMFSSRGIQIRTSKGRTL
ncbi:Protein 21.1 [Giardia lamblia P15]|uniref:Protein 21.1 n=1 Tax=Giardia intestinalis (strain P15) TaxID=658858 RepID=E1F549_GIAIA|nr:Protein 21.1 [Giardia lamblia P15]